MPDVLAADALRAAAERGDYRLVAELASEQAPAMQPQIEQYRIQMELYTEAARSQEWRRALRALADARMAALGAGLPDLESFAADRLYDVVKHYQGRRE